MKITGKCKEDFEKWYKENHCKDLTRDILIKLEFKVFYSSKQSMQYGVYVDFFDSYDIFITDLAYEKPDGDFYYSWEIIGFYGNIYNEKTIKTRQEARQQAVLKANEIYNSKQ